MPPLRELTAWATERGVGLPGLEVRRASLEDVYLELAGATTDPSDDRAALVLHEFRYDQKVFWRNPASVFFTVMLPLIFLFIFATIFGNDEIEELGGQDHDLLRARDRHAGSDLGDHGRARDQPHHRPRARPAEARSRHPAADAGVRAGRVGNSLVISFLMVFLMAVHRQAGLRRLAPGPDAPGAARDPRRRGRSPSPASGSRSPRHPLRGRSARRHERDRSSRCTSSPASSSPTARSRRASCTSPTRFRSARSSRRSSPPGTRTPPARASNGVTSRWLPPGASRGSSSPCSRFAGSRGAESACQSGTVEASRRPRTSSTSTAPD